MARKVSEWVARFLSGLDPRIVRLKEENRDRILNVFMDKMEMGEDINEYEGIYIYSIGQTEPRIAMYNYPDYNFALTREFTNLDMETKVYAGVTKH